MGLAVGGGASSGGGSSKAVTRLEVVDPHLLIMFRDVMDAAETAVRLKHIPSGIVIENSETRSQLDNKNKALILLKSQLYEIELNKKLETRKEIEESKKKIEWGSQIRNYVLHPYKMVKDVRTSTENADANAVLDGDIDVFLKSYLMSKEDK